MYGSRGLRDRLVGTTVVVYLCIFYLLQLSLADDRVPGAMTAALTSTIPTADDYNAGRDFNQSYKYREHIHDLDHKHD
jgi:hypothetical protein